MDFIIIPETSSIFLQLTTAAVLGMVLGVERNLAGKTAGMRTYALVSLGSCLFVIISILATSAYLPIIVVDQLRIMAGVIVGVGFLGAGLIIFHDSKLSGLTTAAGLWVSAGIGMSVGYGYYGIAIFTTTLILFVFTILWLIEQRIKSHSYARDKQDKQVVQVEDENN